MHVLFIIRITLHDIGQVTTVLVPINIGLTLLHINHVATVLVSSNIGFSGCNIGLNDHCSCDGLILSIDSVTGLSN